jgi:SAM-dependent methyltransferase
MQKSMRSPQSSTAPSVWVNRFLPLIKPGGLVLDYLHRPLLPAIARALAPGGVLIYETFARGNERFGRPSNPDFLLRPGELLEAFTTFTVVATQTARLASSEAANPRVPVPKFRVVSLSLTCASRDLTFWRLRTLHASGSQAREESLAPLASQAGCPKL